MDDQPILVVDDDRAIRQMISEVLADEGYPVLTASDGEEALRILAEARPALIVLDMGLPKLDGWAVARQLRDNQLDIPILVVTAAYDAERCAEEIGAGGCLNKPFDLTALLAAVERLRSA